MAKLVEILTATFLRRLILSSLVVGVCTFLGVLTFLGMLNGSQAMAWAAIIFNLAMAFHNMREMRRWRRLNSLLGAICIKAWTLRHAPIWVPWLAMRGLELHVMPVPIGEPEEGPRQKWWRLPGS